MSDSSQFSPAQAFRNLLSSERKLSIVPVISLAFGAILPVVSISTYFRGEIDFSSSYSGFELAGLATLAAIAAFGLAAYARFNPALLRYTNLVDWLALVVLVAAMVWPFFADNQLTMLIDLSRSRPTRSYSLLPHVGTLFVLLAPTALFLVRRLPRLQVVARTITRA